MKVLWFSNCILSNNISKGSGSWLFAMKDILIDQIELINITESNYNEITYTNHGNFQEFIIPRWNLIDGVPSNKNIITLKKIVEEIKPDIIHIWGIEKYWILLFSRNYIIGNPIIEIQGLLSSCYDVFYGGLLNNDIKRFYGIKEFLMRSRTLNNQRKKIKRESKRENEVFKFSYISTQSRWVREQLLFKLSNNTKVFKTRVPLRKEFYNCNKWLNCHQFGNNSVKIITSLSYITPFKGIHILINALAILKIKYPDIKLYICGPNINSLPFFKKNGYEKYLINLINQNKLSNNIIFLGKIDAKELTEHLLNANVYVNTSLVESYSVSTAEALFLGVPSVLSYAGALPNFSNNENIALYYSPLDYVNCASKIDFLLANSEFCSEISEKATNEMNKLCSVDVIKSTQLYIYNQILNDYTNN